MKNRIISLLLALVLVLSMCFVLASCKEDDTPDTNDDKNDDVSDNTEFKAPWDKTSLFFQLSDNSHGKELSSGARRYLHGSTTDVEPIDQSIDRRNAKAETLMNVTVVYDYWPDETDYGWGANIDRISTLALSNSTTVPDMYSVFVYDMVGALLRGSFCNLLSDERGTNYFRFTEEDYNPVTLANPDGDDEGYMYEYMTSLTLSSKKMYLVASDYFTDLVRAFFVVPVNIKLLTENAADITGDADGDGQKGTYLDLIHIVKNRGWNYELLKAYCDEVVQENAEGVVDLDGVVGFAVSASSGLSSSGLLYTTPITIINRLGTSITDYKYSYPETNAQLTDFCEKLATLMSSEGAYAYGGGSTASLDDIRVAFSNNHVLFGGVICVGSLEDEVYQKMRQSGGFGVLPVPIYSDTYTDSYGVEHDTQYLTQIHNLGRIGAIAKSTRKFSQCTAFLNYQSTNSTEILNEYYEWKLAIGVVGGTDAAGANEEMLLYIRENVRSAFDKVFEDALGIYGNFSNDLYHKIIQNGYAGSNTSIKTPNYQIGSNMTSLYAGLYKARQAALGEYDEYGVPKSGLIGAFENGTFGN